MCDTETTMSIVILYGTMFMMLLGSCIVQAKQIRALKKEVAFWRGDKGVVHRILNEPR